MSNTFWVIVCIAIVAAIAGAALYMRNRKKTVVADKRRERLQVAYPTDAELRHRYANAGQPQVQSVDPVPEHALQTIANAVKSEMMVARHYFPTWKQIPIETVAVTIIPSAGNGEDGLPDILLAGFRTAGTVIGTMGGTEWHRLEIILPTFAENNWTEMQYLYDAAYNEMEHFDEAVCDRAEFARFTGYGDVHKHRAVPESITLLPPVHAPNMAIRGLTSRRDYAHKFNCGLQVKK